MSEKKKLARNIPRRVSSKVWYYLNDRSVDLIIDNAPSQARLTATTLRRMLSELRPPSVGKGGKG